MRLVSALLFVALTGSVTLADEAKPADPKPEVSRSKVPLRVVKLLPETHQVLLLHKNKGTHVVAEVGQDVDGYIVDEIDEDEVTLVAPNGAEVILTAPDMTWRRRQAERKAADAKKHPVTGAETASTEASPEDPYADAPAVTAAASNASAPTAAAPSNASATGTPSGEVRVASAGTNAGNAAPPAGVIPADPYADPNAGITAFAEAVGAEPPAEGPPAPAANGSAPTAKAVPAKAKDDKAVDAAGTLAAAATGSPAPVANAFTLSRSEVDAALGDFGMTAITFDAKFVAEGLRIDAIAANTLLERAGLKKGDTIMAVDGKPLRSFDDAADLYARMQTAKAATVIVQRAGKPVTLKVTIR